VRLVWEQIRDGREQILDKPIPERPKNVWLAFFYLKNVVASNTDARKRLELGASACLRVPGARVYDDIRVSLMVIATRLATQILREKQEGKAFGAGDTAFASQVSALWSIWEEAQPDFEPVERLEGQVFSLAAANQLKEAWRAACQREDAQPASPLLAYTMVRIASRLGLIDQSLQWMNFGIGQLAEIDIALCRTNPDLENLRSQKAEEFGRATAVKCQLIFDRQWFRDCLVLTNQSRFRLTQVSMSVERNGARPLLLTNSTALAPGRKSHLARGRAEQARSQAWANGRVRAGVQGGNLQRIEFHPYRYQSASIANAVSLSAGRACGWATAPTMPKSADDK
jgi:hypothetical protein